MSAEEPQMADWNGGIGSEQLAWLKDQLAQAQLCQERVLIACHHQIGAGVLPIFVLQPSLAGLIVFPDAGLIGKRGLAAEL